MYSAKILNNFFFVNSSFKFFPSQSNSYVYMCLSVCLLIVFFCLRPSWKIELSNEWPLGIKSILCYYFVMCFSTRKLNALFEWNSKLNETLNNRKSNLTLHYFHVSSERVTMKKGAKSYPTGKLFLSSFISLYRHHKCVCKWHIVKLSLS